MTSLLERVDTVRPVRGTPRRKPVAVPEQPRKFRPDIEGLRAFAVLSVVLYHAHLFGIRGGFVGVDVFFVISGFLITRQLVSSVGRDGIRALPTFYTRRIKRLLPAGAAVLVATLFVARFWAPALQVKSIATDAIFTTFYGLNYRLAISGTQYLHQTDAVSPLQHFWSLGVEEQFYVIWPAIIALVAFVGHRYRNVLLFVLLSGITVVSFWFSVTLTTTNQPWAYFSLHSRAWELALGGLVALAATKLANMPRRVGELGAFVGLVAMIASAFVYSDATPYPGSAAALPVVGAALVIACGCGPRRKVERMLAEPMLQCIGKISYSWYLWHWPMLILAPDVLGHPLTWQERGIVVLTSMAIAMLSYFVVEDPVRHWKLSNFGWLGGGFAFSGAVIAAGVLVLSNLPALTGSGAAVTLVQAETASPAVIAQMQAAVVAGIDTTDVPSNLTPQPAAAANDTPASSKNGCHADFLTIKQNACVFGDPNGTHTAVLFGDSHMEQWLPAFNAAGINEHWKIVNWTKAACPPAQISVFAPTLNRQYTECDTWRAATLKRIAALKPDRIFVSESENVVPSAVPATEFVNDTITTLKTLASTTKAKVTFINDIPVPNYDMPTCVAQHLSNAQDCDFAMKNAYIYPTRHKVMQPQITKAGFAVVDPADWLCTTKECPAVVGNFLVYRNTTHMTATFSKWLTPMIAPLLTVKR